MPAGPRVLGHISTQVYPFSEENCAGPPTTICEGVPGPKHIPFVVPKWGTNGHKWGLCYFPTRTRHTVDILDPQILKNDEKWVISCLAG